MSVLVTLKKKKQIVSTNKFIKKEIFTFLGKKNKYFSKKQLCLVFYKFFLQKNLRVGKRKLIFNQRGNSRKTFFFKNILKLNCLNFSYNLIINMKGQDEYLRMKNEVDISQLGLLRFKFWRVTKQWVLNIFKGNPVVHNLKKVLNGSVLVLQTESLSSLFEVLELFTGTRVTCVGFFVFNRFFWVDKSLELFLNFKLSAKKIQGLIFEHINFSLFFGVVFSLLFDLFFFLEKSKDANVFAAGF